MNYTMKSGTLYRDGQPAASIRGAFYAPQKTICSPDGTAVFQACVQSAAPPRAAHPQQTRYLQQIRYLLLTAEGEPYLTALPHYADSEGSGESDLSLCRMLQADALTFALQGQELRLVRHNSENYSLYDGSGSALLRIFHRGLPGGWDLYCTADYPPELVCGLFVLCKYMEQENEFLIV